MDFLYILYLRALSPAIDYRAYSHTIDGFSVQQWLARRLLLDLPPERVLALFHDEADGASLKLMRELTGLQFLRTPYRSKLPALADLAYAFRPAHLVCFTPEAAFAPSDLIARAAAHHLDSENDFTCVSSLPAEVTPEIYSGDLIRTLGSVTFSGEPPEPRQLVKKLLDMPGSQQESKKLRAVPFDGSIYGPGPLPRAPQLVSAIDAKRAQAVLSRFEVVEGRAALDAWEHAAAQPEVVPEFISSAGSRDGSKLRVLYVSFPSGYSGAEEALWQFVRHADAGEVVHAAVVSAEGLFARRLRETGVEVACPNWAFAETTDASLQFARNCLKIAQPRVVHFNGDPGVPFIEACADAQVPYVVHLHTADPETFRDAYAGAHTAIAVSEFVARRMTGAGVSSEKIEVVYGGVDLDRFDPKRWDRAEARDCLNLPAEGLIVSIIARAAPNKRYDLLLQALADAAVEVPELHLMAAGASDDSQYARKIRDLAMQLGLAERVTWLPFQTEMERVYAAADILALPSEDDPCPRAVIEAMAMSVPVIVCDSGGSAEMVDHGSSGLVLPPGDASRLASALVALARDASMRTEMGGNGRHRAMRRFSSKLCSERFVQVLHRAASRA